MSLTQLIECGVALVPIPERQKSPRVKDWNPKQNCIVDVTMVSFLGTGNIGLAHAYCKPKAKQSAPVRLCRHLTTCTSPAYFTLLTFNSETNAELIGTRRLS